MCLTGFKKVTLKDDKVVYKVLAYRKADTSHFKIGDDSISIFYSYKEDTYESPYNPFPWKYGVRATAEKSDKDEHPHEINSGYFHSFEHIQDAIVELKSLQAFEMHVPYILGKFTIPKDTEVYYGYYGCSCLTCYCSKEIIFNEAFVLDDFEDVKQVLSFMSANSNRVWYDENERESVVDAIRKTKAKLDFWKKQLPDNCAYESHHYNNYVISCKRLIESLTKYLEWYDKGMFNIV